VLLVCTLSVDVLGQANVTGQPSFSGTWANPYGSSWAKDCYLPVMATPIAADSTEATNDTPGCGSRWTTLTWSMPLTRFDTYYLGYELLYLRGDINSGAVRRIGVMVEFSDAVFGQVYINEDDGEWEPINVFMVGGTAARKVGLQVDGSIHPYLGGESKACWLELRNLDPIVGGGASTQPTTYPTTEHQPP